MQLHQDQAGRSAGTIEYPSLHCVGSLVLFKTEKQVLWFRETIQQGRGKCQDGGLIAITPNSSGVLGWQYFRLGDASSPSATATFTKSRGQGKLRRPAQETASRRTLEQEAVEQRNAEQPTERGGKSDTAQTDTASSNGTAQAAATEALLMARDVRTDCKAWKPNLLSNETVHWSGACVSGYANGVGIAQWFVADKEVLRYEGTFVSGVLQGTGSMSAAGGDRYDGKYRDGKRDGHGVYVTGTGLRYDGEFRDNVKHGAGTITDATGVRARVEFRDGQQIK